MNDELNFPPNFERLVQPKIVNIFSRMKNEFQMFFHFLRRILHFVLRIFDEFLSGFRDKFQKRVMCFAFSIEFAKTN